jgi:hypothetical protein
MWVQVEIPEHQFDLKGEPPTPFSDYPFKSCDEFILGLLEVKSAK